MEYFQACLVIGDIVRKILISLIRMDEIQCVSDKILLLEYLLRAGDTQLIGAWPQVCQWTSRGLSDKGRVPGTRILAGVPRGLCYWA